MKTEWHRYNLKRRVSQLPCISSHVFAEKVFSQKLETQDQNEDELGFYVHARKHSTGQRQVTKKMLKRMLREEITAESGQASETNEEWVRVVARPSSPATSVLSEFSRFSIGNSEDTRLITTDNASEFLDSGSEYTDMERVESSVSGHSEIDLEYLIVDNENLDDAPDHFNAEEDFDPTTRCFYCEADNAEMELNIRHMFRAHGLYIPERTYLSNARGLLTFLADRIFSGLECIVCGFEGSSIESTRQHIESKGHARVPYESKEEKAIVSEFYEFYVEGDKRRTSTKKVAFLHNESSVGSEEESSRQHDDGSLITDEDSDDDEKIPQDINANYTIAQIDESGKELILPTGSRLGHRSMMIRHHRQGPARDLADSTKTVAVADRRLAPGVTWNEVARLMKHAQQLEQKQINVNHRKTKTRKANFQRHFRDEILGT